MPFLATVTLNATSGLPEDAVTNSFGFVGDAPTSATIGPLVGALADFYNFPARTSEDQAIAWHLNKSLSRTAGDVDVKAYDLTGHLDGSPHGSPTGVGSFTLGAAHTTAPALPNEVAVAITLRASGWESQLVEAPDGGDAGTALDRPRQKYSGRLYIGPLNTLGMVESPAGHSRVSEAFRDVCLAAVNRLHDAEVGINALLAVWSRRDAAMRSITHAQVDDAWDTQRRRGLGSTVRSQLTL